jgi:hypothetical protein
VDFHDTFIGGDNKDVDAGTKYSGCLPCKGGDIGGWTCLFDNAEEKPAARLPEVPRKQGLRIPRMQGAATSTPLILDVTKYCLVWE